MSLLLSTRPPKSSVLFSWLALLENVFDIEPKKVQQLGQAILMGAEALADFYGTSRLEASLSLQARQLVREAALSIETKFDDVVAAQSGLLEAVPVDSELAFWAERIFLGGYAYLRIGNRERGWKLWNQLHLLQLEDSQRKSMLAKIKIEEANQLLNRGYFLRCIEMLDSTQNSFEKYFDTFSLLNALALRDIASQVLGRYDEADIAAAKHAKICESFPSKAFEFSAIRRRIMGLIERDSFLRAADVIAEAFSRPTLTMRERALLLQLKIHVELVRNQVDSAENEIAEVRELLAKESLARGIINIEEEECELFLRKRRPELAMPYIESLLSDARDRGDILAEFIGKIYWGRCLAQLGSHDFALSILEEACRIGEEQRYGSLLVEAQFHAMGVAFEVNDIAKVELFLSRAQILTESLGLDLRQRCFEYIERMLRGRQQRVELMLSLGTAQSEVSYYLEFYGFLKTSEFIIRSERSVSRIDEDALRKMLFSVKALFYFKREQSLVSGGTKQPVEVKIDSDSLQDKLLNLLLQKPLGVTMDEIHALNHTTEFHRIKHGARLKTFLHRFRLYIQTFHLGLNYNKESERYFVVCPLPLFTLEPARESKGAAAGDKPSHREIEILDIMNREGAVPTTRLSQLTGMSRQALHPHLKRLVDEGRIRLRRRGRSSFYTLISRSVTK